MFSYVVFAPKIRLKLSYVYFVLNKVPLLHNNGSCILISKMSSKNIVIVVWQLWKFETDWRKEIEFERLKIIDGCALIFDSHKIHKCQMIKTLNADNGMEYCCNEWNVPLNNSSMHVLSLFWVFIFQRWNYRNWFFKSMKTPSLNILMQIRQFTQNQPKYE